MQTNRISTYLKPPDFGPDSHSYWRTRRNDFTHQKKKGNDMNKLVVTVTVAVLAAGAFAKDAESELYSLVTNRQSRVENAHRALHDLLNDWPEGSR